MGICPEMNRIVNLDAEWLVTSGAETGWFYFPFHNSILFDASLCLSVFMISVNDFLLFVCSSFFRCRLCAVSRCLRNLGLMIVRNDLNWKWRFQFFSSHLLSVMSTGRCMGTYWLVGNVLAFFVFKQECSLSSHHDASFLACSATVIIILGAPWMKMTFVSL